MTNQALTTEQILAVALDAHYEGRAEESAPLFAAVRAHATKEGIEDYLQRSGDVDTGNFADTWAWPFDTADEAYLNAVGTTQICREIGIPVEAWEEISDVWLEAFAAGYKAAHEAE